MAGMRYLDAVLIERAGDTDGPEVRVPLRDDQDDAPATLVDPLPGHQGGWTRETDRHERPARYLRVG